MVGKASKRVGRILAPQAPWWPLGIFRGLGTKERRCGTCRWMTAALMFNNKSVVPTKTFLRWADSNCPELKAMAIGSALSE